MRCTIWHQWYNFKKVKSTHGGVLNCKNATKSLKTSAYVVWNTFKIYFWYQKCQNESGTTKFVFYFSFLKHSGYRQVSSCLSESVLVTRLHLAGKMDVFLQPLKSKLSISEYHKCFEEIYVLRQRKFWALSGSLKRLILKDGECVFRGKT